MPRPGSGSRLILEKPTTRTRHGDTVTKRALANRDASKAAKKKPRAKPWKPELKVLRSADGRERTQTEEAAWSEARQLVRHYVTMGYTRGLICELMQPPITQNQLEKLFIYDLENGLHINRARIGAVAFQMAASGQDGNMTRFWLRSKAGWKDFESPGSTAPIKVVMIDGDDTI